MRVDRINAGNAKNMIKIFKIVLFGLACIFLFIFLYTKITVFGIVGYASMTIGSITYIVSAVVSLVRKAKEKK